MNRFFKNDTGKIHYSENGKGDVVVLVHGYLETSKIWSSFAGKLALKYRVISVNLPGHGKSDMFADTHTMELMATLIRDLLRSSGIERVFLTGHSLGGYVTLAFAELFPEMLSGYCLFHSHPLADTEEILVKRKKEIELVLAGGKDLIYPESIKRMYATDNLNKFSAAFRRSKMIASSICGEAIIAVLRGMMERPSRLSVMEEGKVPCLWILGALDSHINCEQIRTRVRLPQNAEVVILRNSGHMGFVEEEEEALQVLMRFADRFK